MRINPEELQIKLEELILRLLVSDDSELNRRLDRIEHNIGIIMGNQADEAVMLQAIADDLLKVKTGIDALKQSVADLTAALANAQTTPEVDAALANIQANLAQVDADLPAPPAPPTP